MYTLLVSSDRNIATHPSSLSSFLLGSTKATVNVAF